MVKLGPLNSRIKDFYDIWLLSRHFDFDGARLSEAIRLTFERRGAKAPVEVEAFSESFIQAKQPQWAAFRKRLQKDSVPASFREIVTGVDEFLTPMAAAVSSGRPALTTWTAPGPWS